MKKVILMLFFLISANHCFSQIDPDCNDDYCGGLDPSWQLVGTETVACEGEVFSLRSAESNPANNIDSYTWILTNLVTDEIIYEQTFPDTTWLSFGYEVPDELACNDSKINIEVRLVVTSPDCTVGGQVVESCRYTAEPLTILFKPTARFNATPLFCEGIPVQFNNESCNAESYAWDFDGDGNTDSTEENPSFTYNTPGVYSASLTVTNECGSDAETQTIDVLGIPETDLVLIDGGEGCAPDRQRVTFIPDQWITNQLWEVEPLNGGTWCHTHDTLSMGTDCYPNTDEYEFLFEEDTLDMYISSPGDYEVSFTYGNECFEKILIDTIHIYASPTISPLNDINGCDQVTVCFEQLGLALGGDITNYNWTFTGSTGSNYSDNSSPDFGCRTFNGAGTISLELEGIHPCPNTSRTANINVITTGTVNVSDISDPICQNDDPIYINPTQPNGQYFNNGSEVTYISGDTLDPSGLNPGSYTLDYIIGFGTDCPAEDDFSFTILEGPSIELGEYDAYCQNAINFDPTIGMTSGGDIGTWTWQICDTNGNVVEMSTSPDPTFDITIPGEYSVKVSVTSGECGTVSDTSSLFIQADDPVMITPINTPICQGSSPIILEATPEGGYWSGTGVSSDGTFDPMGLPPDMYTITYSINNEACSSTDMITVEVVASEVVTAVEAFFCITDMPAMLEVSPTGGTFEGDAVTEDGILDPQIAGIGTSTVIYNYVDDNACEIIIEIAVIVDELPAITVNDPIFVCIDPNDVNLNPEITTTGIEGTLTFDGQGISEEGIFNGSGLSEGFYDIEVTLTTRSCIIQDTFVIELGDKPELIMPADMTVCVDDGTLMLNTNVEGGDWSSNDANCTIDPDTGEIDLEAIGEHTCTFTYTLSAGTSCEQSDVVSVEILDLNNDIIVPPPASVCFTNATYTFSNFSPLEGTWSGEGIINATDGVVDISILEPGMTYEYEYCIESQIVQECEACKTTTLFIAPLPVAAFTTDVPPCQDQAFTLINNSVGATSYEWNFGDGSPISTQFEPMHTYTTEGDFNLQLIVITNYGCRDTLVQEIHVTPPPTLDIEILTQEGCAPLTIDYTNNSTGEGIEQYWIIGGVDTLFESQPEIVLDNVQTDSLITIELWVVNGCAALTDSVHVLVHPYPTVDFGITHRVGCSPDTIDFMNITLGNPTEIFWDFGNGNTSTEYDPGYQVYTSPDDSVSTYYVTLVATNECGSDTLIKPITINPNNVDAFFELNASEGCPPFEVCVTNYATIGATIIYDFGDGGTSITPDTCYIYQIPGEYIITQSAELCGIDFFQSDTIKVFPLPLLDVDFPQMVCVDDTVYFENNSIGAAAEWDFGDSQTSNNVSPSHTYQNSGDYTVELIMYSDFYACPDTLRRNITVREQLIAAPIAAPTTACPGDAIQFSVGSSATNYAWDFGDGQGATEAVTSHTYTESGTYQVTLTVYDEFDCPNDSTIFVVIHEAPESEFVLNTNEICQFYDTIIAVNQSTDYITNQWYLNGNFYTNQNDSLLFAPSESGIYEVMLISENAFSCRDTFTQNFEVLASPVAEILASPTEGCEALTVDFTDISKNSEWTLWTFGNNNTSTETNTTFTYDTGEYTALLTVGANNGCPDDTTTINIAASPSTVADFTAVLSDSCGVPATLTLENLSQGSDNFAWNFGDGTTSNVFEPTHTYIAAGSYTIELMTNNIHNCPDTARAVLDVFPQPIAGFSIPESRLCEGDTLQINDLSIDATSVIWLVDGEAIEGDNIILTEAGNYAISQVAIYEESCSDTTSITQTVFVYETPTADFSYIADNDPIILGDVQFTNESTDANDYIWNFGDNTPTSTELNPYHEFRTNPPSKVVLVAFNNNNSVFTCVDSTSQLVDYEKIHTFYAPNALSPDQSFGNELVKVFRPVGLGIADYQLEIFSPWGDIVARLNNVENGSPDDEWDGTYKGNIVPQGAYLWTAKINYTDGHYEFKKGTVTVVR